MDTWGKSSGLNPEKGWRLPPLSGHKHNLPIKIMPNITILPQGLENESDDAPKKFRNIDTEDFICTWDNKQYIVKAGEIVTHPKYLVNYMAMHLARKIYKRKIFEGKSEAERSIGILRFVNAEEEIKLMKEMVKDNFEEETPKISVPPLEPNSTTTSTSEPTLIPTIPTEEKKEEEKKPEEVSWKCEICGFVAKNKVGLLAHKRFRHKS